MLTREFKSIAPDTVQFFGPFAYGVAQIEKNIAPQTGDGNETPTTEFVAQCDGEPITSTEVWSYKYDSLSIVLRGAVRLLGVSEFPRCVMYAEECPSVSFSLETTFTMLDALVTALCQDYFQPECYDTRYRSRPAHYYPPFVVETKSFWVDRFYHYLLKKLAWRYSDTRLHAFYHYESDFTNLNQTVALCSAYQPKAEHPFFCDQALKVTTPTSEQVRVADHIAQRFAALAAQFPDLQFDLTLFTNQFPASNRRQMPQLPSCATAARLSVRSRDARDGYGRLVPPIARGMRGFAQLYLWIRIWLLWWGCYFARCEPKVAASTSLARRLRATWSTFFKIPSQVITYGSSVPIMLYASAHFIDGGVMHTICENAWSSLNGAVDADIWAYMSVASVQMRNIWYIALAVKLVVVIQVYCIPQRTSPWQLSHGFFRIRGGMIRLLSSLTITAYLRIPGFRNTDVFAARRVGFESLRIQRQFSLSEEGGTEFGFYFDMRMIAAVTLILLSTTVGLKVLAAFVCGSASRLLRRRMPALGGIICSKSTLIPYSTGNLASLTVMSLIWKMTVQHDSEDHSQELRPLSLASPGPRRTWKAVLATKIAPQRTKGDLRTSIFIAASKAVPANSDKVSTAIDLCHVAMRSKATWSVVQLVNIALLTEPLVLVKLYVVGQALYLYRAKDRAKSMLDDDDAKNSQSLFLLLCNPVMLAQNTTVDGDLHSSIYELVEVVDSRTVPWRLMVFCG